MSRLVVSCLVALFCVLEQVSAMSLIKKSFRGASNSNCFSKHSSCAAVGAKFHPTKTEACSFCENSPTCTCMVGDCSGEMAAAAPECDASTTGERKYCSVCSPLKFLVSAWVFCLTLRCRWFLFC